MLHKKITPDHSIEKQPTGPHRAAGHFKGQPVRIKSSYSVANNLQGFQAARGTDKI